MAKAKPKRRIQFTIPVESQAQIDDWKKAAGKVPLAVWLRDLADHASGRAS